LFPALRGLRCPDADSQEIRKSLVEKILTSKSGFASKVLGKPSSSIRAAKALYESITLAAAEAVDILEAPCITRVENKTHREVRPVRRHNAEPILAQERIRMKSSNGSPYSHYVSLCHEEVILS
jgi:hypothetical protein